jgi:protein tyrosine phosphatase
VATSKFDGMEDSEELSAMRKYISACYINGLVRDHSEKSIIACQGPVQQTMSKFWQMAWENECSLIVMICPFGNSDKDECIDYWSKSDSVGDLWDLESINSESRLKIKLTEKTQLNDRMTLRKLTLIQGEESRDIEHL